MGSIEEQFLIKSGIYFKNKFIKKVSTKVVRPTFSNLKMNKSDQSEEG